jgi:hypothetical protein
MAIAIAEWYFASRIETINLSEPLEREARIHKFDGKTNKTAE